jgi:hypothetical protein
MGSRAEDQVNNQTTSTEELWLAYCRAEQAADEALRPFLAAVPDPVAFLAPDLHRSGRVYALRVLERRPEVERRRVLPDLVTVASTTVRELRFVQSAIASLDRTWLEANIEPHVWRQLGPEATDEQYRRLAELLDGLGLADLLNQVIERAAASTDENIREVAEDWKS